MKFRWLKWRLLFWWFPPKNIRSIGWGSRVEYDATVSYGLYLYFLHIAIDNGVPL